MELSPDESQYILDLSTTLFRGAPVNGIRYDNSLVSGPGVDDTYDPDMLFKPILATGYWPDGGFGGRSYAATQIGEPVGSTFDANEERLFLRRLITGSSVGAAALERYVQYARSKPELQLIKQMFGDLVVPEVVEVCRVRQSPFSYMIVGPVLRSETIPVGNRVAFLYYPSGVSPKTSLAHLRRAVRNTELEEML